MTSSASIAPIARMPNWLALRIMAPEPAAEALAQILTAWDRIEEMAFAVRGEAMLLIEERELYHWIVDEEVGDYYQSFDKWLKDTLPRSWGYCRDALRARKACRAIPFTDFAQMKRCNIEQLKQSSESVRILPEVVQAAKSLPEKQFVAKLNQEHNQHLEAKQPVIMAAPSVSGILEQAIEMAMALEGCKSREEALEGIAAYFVTGCQSAYEKYLAEHQVEAEQTA
jgi:hypothetical protein